MVFAMKRILALLVAGMLATGANAQSGETITYDITIAGFRTAVLGVSAIEEENRYAVAGKIEITGIAALFRSIEINARSRGQRSGSEFVPTHFTEVNDNGRRVRTITMEFSRGVPQNVTFDPPRTPKPFDLDPSTQRNATDPMTAIWELLRPGPRAAACTLDVSVFDGRRRNQVRIDTVEDFGDRVVCSGEFARVAGFSPESLAERSGFPFQLTYTELDNGQWAADRIVFQAKFGRAEISRR